MYDHSNARRDSSGLFRHVIQFLRAHWVHLLILIPMIPVVTLVHEAAHAAVIRAHGGTLIEFSFWPGDGLWGYVKGVPAPGRPIDPWLLSLAPYLLWLITAAFAAGVAALPGRKPFGLASTLFVWAYAVPILDIANAAWGYVLANRGDFSVAFGPATFGGTAAILLAGVALALLGYPVQRGLYGARALRGGGYFVLATLAAAGVMAVPVL